MTILSAQSIRKRHEQLCMKIREPGLIQPFHERTVSDGSTFGLGPAGYDVRLDQDVAIPPNGFTLASIMEWMNVSTDMIAFVHDKSTWARRGLALQNTVIEPGWRGYLTLEITNHSDDWAFLSAGCPIAQIVFHWLDAPTEIPYRGKYQNQERGPQAARMEKGNKGD